MLVENVKPVRNVGKLDLICILNLFFPIIGDGNTISNSGINQLRVECTDWIRANKLVECNDLVLAGIRAFIPDSFLGTKGSTTRFPTTRAIADIVSRLDKSMSGSIISVKRVFDRDGRITDRVEFMFNTNCVPEGVALRDYTINLTPSAPRLRRCYKCQIFAHPANQCRSTYPSCEFCAEKHLTLHCFNRNN